MLETLREYALLRLAEHPEHVALQQRHAAYALGFAQAADAELHGADQGVWLSRLDEEHDNLRAALAWACAQQSDLALDLAITLRPFWYRRGHFAEGRQWLASALSQQPAAPLLVRVNALNAAGVLALGQSDYAAALPVLEEAVELGRTLDDPLTQANIGCNLAITLQDLDRYDEAERLFVDSLATFRNLEDVGGVAYVLTNLGVLEYNRGSLERAQGYANEAFTAATELEDQEGIFIALDNLGMVAREQGDYLGATTHFKQALALARELDDPHGTAHVLTNQGVTSFLQADYVGARTQVIEALAIYHALDDRQGMVEALEACANVCAKTNDEHTAVAIWGASETARVALGAQHNSIDRRRYRGMVDDLRGRIGSAQFDQALDQARQAPLDDVVEQVLQQPAPQAPSSMEN
jgi:tetratricopeptide (TPR) repeat protein